MSASRTRARRFWIPSPGSICATVLLGALAACGGSDNAEEATVVDPGQPGTTVAFQLLPKKMSLNVGGQAAALVFGNDGAVTWSSSDTVVAKVDDQGIVTAAGRGTATISATANGKTASTPLRVYDPAGTPADATSESLIAAALVAGRIDAEQALVYRVLARFGDARLPPEYEGATSPDAPAVALKEVQRRLPALSPSAQQALAPFLVPPVYRESWLGLQLGVAPAAAAAARVAAQSAKADKSGAAAAAVTIHCAETSYPEFYYRKSTAHFNVVTLQGFSPTAVATVDRLAGMVEQIYAAETSLLQRFPKSDIAQPCNGGDGAIDIYIAPLGFDSENLAETVPFAGCNDVPAFIVVNENISDTYYFVARTPDQRADVDKRYRNVLAHEFMHVLQFGMKRSAACDDYDWIDEATAEWAMDYVFPADNQEDGTIRWTQDRIRGGGFFVSYLVNEHRTSIEKSLGTSSGYDDYVFFQFVARTHGGAAIRAIFDAMISNDSVEAIDVGLKAQGGMKEVWPKFARALWLDRDNDALPSVLFADGYDVGLKDVFAGVARGHTLGGGSVHQPVTVSLQQGRVRKVLLEEAGTFGGGTTIEPRSFHYEYLKFDDVVSGVVLMNPIGGAVPGVRVEMLKKIDGRWSAPEDITNKADVSFCRDRRDDRIDELLVIVSHGGGRRDAAPVVLAEDRPMFVAASNVGCWKWQGESTERIVSDDGFGNTGDYTARATGIVFDVQTRDLFAGAATFATTAGTASGISRSKSTLPCDISITGPAQSVGASDGFMWLGLDLDLAPVAAPTRYLSVLQGLTAIESTSDSVCLGQHVVRTFMNAWNWLAFPVLSHPLAVSEDGKTIEADFTEAQEGMRATHTLRFTAMRE